MTTTTALTIAGSDSGGGAGITADLKTFEANAVWGTAAIVAVTAQNTLGVQAYERVSPELVRAQIESVAGDIGVGAAKTGMLADAELVSTVAAAVSELGISPLVVDPVFVSKHGDPLLAPEAVETLRAELLPLAALATPNLPEAAGLAGMDEGEVATRAGMEEAGRRIVDSGCGAVLVKGGHLRELAGEVEGADGAPGAPGASGAPGRSEAPDCLVSAQGTRWLVSERVPGGHTHGTGCVLSAAAAARLARGEPLEEAVEAAKRFVTEAIRRGVDLGGGVGPVNPGAVLGNGSID